MIRDMVGGKLYVKQVFALISIMLLTCSAAYSADAPGKAVKPSSTQSEAKIDTGEWKKVVETAKREGKLFLTADPSELYRKALVIPFEKKYPEIKVEYTGMNGADFRARLLQERKFAQYLWDLRISGLDQDDYELKDKGFFDPIRALVLPEIADDGKWHGGFAYAFTDKEQKYFTTAVYVMQYTVMINRDFISEAQLGTSKQLLDPQFKGKISIHTPQSGAGLASIQQLALLYGENFVRELFQKQGVVITSDKRQIVEWLVRGKYPIALGMVPGFLLEYQKKGMGRNILPAKKSGDASLKAVRLVNKAPHPNAARVYLNWILSEEGQREIVKGIEGASMRKDVDPFDKELPPDPLSESHRRMYEENMGMRGRAEKLVSELVK